MSELSQYELLCNDLLPILRKIPGSERYAITLGGSQGKGLSDNHSDYDFRVYYDERVGIEEWNVARKELDIIIKKWGELGIEIDGAWSRSFADIDKNLEQWLTGNGQPDNKKWTIWGYNILTDIYNQAIVEDPFGIATEWKKRLEIYPDELQFSIIEKYSSSLKYWKSDYHYLNKIRRQDIVFLSSITSLLVHDIIQIIYALNKFYYPGDGLNLTYTPDFKIKPNNFENRIAEILYPISKADIYKQQYDDLMKLIDDVLILISEGRPDNIPQYTE